MKPANDDDSSTDHLIVDEKKRTPQAEIKPLKELSPKPKSKHDDRFEKMRQRMKETEERQPRGLQQHRTAQRELEIPRFPVLRTQSSLDSLLVERRPKDNDQLRPKSQQENKSSEPLEYRPSLDNLLGEYRPTDPKQPRPSLQLFSSQDPLGTGPLKEKELARPSLQITRSQDETQTKGAQRERRRPSLQLKRSIEFLDRVAGKVKQSEISFPTLRMRRSMDTLRQVNPREPDRPRPSLQVNTRPSFDKPKETPGDRLRGILRLRKSQDTMRHPEKDEKKQEKSVPPTQLTIAVQSTQGPQQPTRKAPAAPLSPIDSPTLIEQKTLSAILDSFTKASSTKRLKSDQPLQRKRSNTSFQQNSGYFFSEEPKKYVRKTHSSEEITRTGSGRPRKTSNSEYQMRQKTSHEHQVLLRRRKPETAQSNKETNPWPERRQSLLLNTADDPRARIEQRRRTNSKQSVQNTEISDEDATPTHKQTQKLKGIAVSNELQPRLFACPFYQHAPEQHQNSGCVGAGWEFDSLK
jgi:hypothetical protein